MYLKLFNSCPLLLASVSRPQGSFDFSPVLLDYKLYCLQSHISILYISFIIFHIFIIF